MNISKFCTNESKYVLSIFSLFSFILISLCLCFFWTSQWGLIRGKHWIFLPSPHSHQAVDHFFSSSWCFFKHVKEMDFLSQSQQASPDCGTLPRSASALVFNLPVRLQQRLQSRSDPPLCLPDVLSNLRVQDSLGSLSGCCLSCVYSEEMCSLQLWIWKPYTHWFCVVLLSSWRIWPLLIFHAVWDKYLPKPTGSPPNPMPLGRAEHSSIIFLQYARTK